MFDTLKKLLDPYEIKARFIPTMFSSLPSLVTGVLLFPKIVDVWMSIGVLILIGGGALMLGQLGRDRGKKLEQSLFDSWGGKPSVAMLRHRDSRIDPTTKSRYHDFLSRNVPNFKLTTHEEERQHPVSADACYEGG